QAGAAHEVHLAADAAVDPGPDRISHHLPGQIDLNRRVDGNHALDPADFPGVVHDIGRVKLDERIVVDEAGDPGGAQRERGHDPVSPGRFVLAGDDPGVHQVDQAVREHLGVHTEILV